MGQNCTQESFWDFYKHFSDYFEQKEFLIMFINSIKNFDILNGEYLVTILISKNNMSVNELREIFLIQKPLSHCQNSTLPLLCLLLCSANFGKLFDMTRNFIDRKFLNHEVFCEIKDIQKCPTMLECLICSVFFNEFKNLTILVEIFKNNFTESEIALKIFLIVHKFAENEKNNFRDNFKRCEENLKDILGDFLTKFLNFKFILNILNEIFPETLLFQNIFPSFPYTLKVLNKKVDLSKIINWKKYKNSFSYSNAKLRGSLKRDKKIVASLKEEEILYDIAFDILIIHRMCKFGDYKNRLRAIGFDFLSDLEMIKNILLETFQQIPELKLKILNAIKFLLSTIFFEDLKINKNVIDWLREVEDQS